MKKVEIYNHLHQLIFKIILLLQLFFCLMNKLSSSNKLHQDKSEVSFYSVKPSNRGLSVAYSSGLLVCICTKPKWKVI